MTVRAWITISTIVLVALAAAVGFQFLRPIEPPPIVVISGEQRIEGAFDAGCWPQRDGVLRCTEGSDEPSPGTIRSKGSLRVALLAPVQPKDGQIRITDAEGETVLKAPWQRTIRYDLGPGDYTLTALAGEKDKAYVRYAFALRVTRSGS